MTQDERNAAIVASLPTDSDVRKNIPLARGVLDYFPAALAEVAKLSRAGNDKHNPGQELHWARGKSGDHADCILRHLVDRGTVDTDGIRHAAKVAWRALALLQEELEAAGLAPLARGARVDAPVVLVTPGRWRVPQLDIVGTCGDGPKCSLCWRDATPAEVLAAPSNMRWLDK